MLEFKHVPNGFAAVAIFVLALAPSHPVRADDIAATNTTAGPVCWSADQLRFREGEQQVHKRTAASIMDPPRPSGAPFTPITQRGVIRRVNLPPGKKLIALTFDLCETPDEVAGYQGDVVDTLRQNNVRATFFSGGKWMLSHEERAAQLLADPLFQVENHTWEHRNLRLLSGQELSDEIDNATLAYGTVRSRLIERKCAASDNSDIAQRTGSRPKLFRFPFGACNPESLDVVAQQGMIAVQWDVSSGDPARGETSPHMTRDVLENARPGSIVLFHANGRGYNTPAALPSIIEGLRKQGYQFVTVDELIKAGEPVYASSCYDNKPGDTDHYDKLARSLDSQYKAFRASMVKAKIATPDDNRTSKAKP
ncbi:MAG: polysaccharide deacetylase family protein [Afipia sp.]|nr:polysaccharide deacetylase family protein [Afipia sp.]